jgi:phenylacetate-coenzyme A ligase PaaK-like adenylate-forming protein
VWDDLKTYGRFVRKLPVFLRHKVSLAEARAVVERRLAEREASFLRLVERGIFDHERSPYRPLLRWAGCELGDLQQMVRTKGLEGTLRALRQAGVYVTFEEFKGRAPIVRGSQTMSIQAEDFDNPYLSHYYYASSGGTTGAGTRVAIDLDFSADMAPLWALVYDAHGVLGMITGMWRNPLPDSTGINHLLYTARLGHIPRKWFSPVTRHDAGSSLMNWLATQSFVCVGRLFGAPFPWPEHVPLNQAIVIARWAAETLRTHGACLIRAHVSMALRVAIAAREEGLDLTGATFMGGGEPPTPAKVQEIKRSGARWVPVYVTSETGLIGAGCVQPVDGNDLHFFKDALALIQHPRQVPGLDMTVAAFNFTTLLPSAPKLMLNVESDDYGVIEHRSCGCQLEGYGFTEHLRDVRSFRKLTGEGVTLVGSEMLRILEEVLPARFGGSPLDYQLLEEEDDQGFTRLSLLVSPAIKLADEQAVIETLLTSLSQSSVAADLAQAQWRQAGTLRIKRQEPIPTARGKLMPLHLNHRFGGRAEPSTDSGEGA